MHCLRAVCMEESEINTVQRRSSSHIQSYYSIRSVTVKKTRLGRDVRGKRNKETEKKMQNMRVWGGEVRGGGVRVITK